jgi:hypothetical protein
MMRAPSHSAPLRGLLWLCLSLGALSAGCPNTPPPPPEEVQNLTLRAVLRNDLTAVDLVVSSPVTLSTLQATLVFDPASATPGAARVGANGPSAARVFDDSERVPGRLLVGIADLNRNPLPRQGAVITVDLSKTLPGASFSVEEVVAVDLFGNKVEVKP